MASIYYLGLDIGTNSVGYAVTDEYYQLIKKKREPVIGVHTFEEGKQAAERRAFRTARRRIDRRQQRVALLNELFALEIGKKDPRFFIRRSESRMYRDETQDAYPVFNDPGFTDKEYYRRYPTIHHLIADLMQSDEARDVRLVYLACAWLVANRGHFLFDISADHIDQLLDFDRVYRDFTTFMADEERNYPLPWPDSVTGQQILAILCMNAGVKRKQDAFKAEIFQGKALPKKREENEPYCRKFVVDLLCGAKVKPEDIFQTGAYPETESITLTMADEEFVRILGELDEEDGELLRKLRALQDCALLITAQQGKASLSEAKIAVYEQHRADLAGLKKLVRKYLPKDYKEIFRKGGKELKNYTAYSLNVKSCREPGDIRKASVEDFSDYLSKKLKNIQPRSEDLAFYEDIMARLETHTFLPKQKTTDNRVIPQQLYRYELETILNHAENYLPLLKKKDESGLTVREKIISIFDFRIPYYVGPLKKFSTNSNAWMVRRAGAEGKIYPWNFKSMVDFDASENAFIRRMTNKCTYLAGEDVLPAKSLLYSKYTVLNEINNLKINEQPIPVEIKQRIYRELFEQLPRVTLKKITDWFRANGLTTAEDRISGVDIKINASLSSYHSFRRLLGSGQLSEADAERIIERAAFSEDKQRMNRWLEAEYPALAENDRVYICRLNLKEFGRLSAKLLTGIYEINPRTGEAMSILDALWNTNENLMQLLSERHSYRKQIEEQNREYYAGHASSLSQRLDEMALSNAVKRPILRTLDICADVVKAMGCPPEKIFIEMARGAAPEQAGRRTQTRKQQLEALYKSIKTTEARQLEKELQSMGAMADNRLQSDVLFLYYLQMGKCAYTGKPIDLARLADGTYNKDHIYPRAFVKDDSVINNLVLVDSGVNGSKTNQYPVSEEIRSRMESTWRVWKELGLMSEEKYRRLTRSHAFTEEEKWSFINRQLVETRQSTKAVAQLLQEKYPKSRMVYVKAGLVSEFRQKFDLIKSRQVNDLHHAKDAYLNIVVGNVYDSRFSKNWFNVNENYSLKVETIFTRPVRCGKNTVWQGEPDIAKVKTILQRNAIHLTRYAFCRKGGLFDQMPLKKAEGLVPLKAGLDPAKYGGYNKATASFFSLVKYSIGKKTDVIFMPVELMVAEQYQTDETFALDYAKKTISAICGKPVITAELLLGLRPIKINTILSLDGLHMAINGKSGGGSQLILSLAEPLVVGREQETYIKALESFAEKKKENKNLLPDAEHDHITAEKNLILYDILLGKMENRPYNLCPGNMAEVLKNGRARFEEAETAEQIGCLLNIVSWFSAASGGCDLSTVGGSKRAGAKYPQSTLSSWKKKYKDVRIRNVSASGIYTDSSENLLNHL